MDYDVPLASIVAAIAVDLGLDLLRDAWCGW